MKEKNQKKSLKLKYNETPASPEKLPRLQGLDWALCASTEWFFCFVYSSQFTCMKARLKIHLNVGDIMHAFLTCEAVR